MESFGKLLQIINLVEDVQNADILIELIKIECHRKSLKKEQMKNGIIAISMELIKVCMNI